MQAFLKTAVRLFAATFLLLGALASPAPRTPRPRSRFASPGRSMSAGCRGPTPSTTGIVKKWADKYGITIELVTQINDYVEFDQPVHRRQVRRRAP